jgi:hypothetical protein
MKDDGNDSGSSSSDGYSGGGGGGSSSSSSSSISCFRSRFIAERFSEYFQTNMPVMTKTLKGFKRKQLRTNTCIKLAFDLEGWVKSLKASVNTGRVPDEI